MAPQARFPVATPTGGGRRRLARQLEVLAVPKNPPLARSRLPKRWPAGRAAQPAECDVGGVRGHGFPPGTSPQNCHFLWPVRRCRPVLTQRRPFVVVAELSSCPSEPADHPIAALVDLSQRFRGGWAMSVFTGSSTLRASCSISLIWSQTNLVWSVTTGWYRSVGQRNVSVRG